MTRRILQACLVAASATDVLVRDPWPSAAIVLPACLLQVRPGLLPSRGRLVDGAAAALVLCVALLARETGGPWLLLLLPAILRSLGAADLARDRGTVRDATILAMAVLAFEQSPASLAGAAAATLLLALLLPRLQAERLAAVEGRGEPVPYGAAWTVPVVAAVAALLFPVLTVLSDRGADEGKASPVLGERRGRRGGTGTGEPGGSAAITAARRVSIGDIGRLQRDLRPVLEITVLRGGRPADAEDLGPLFRSGALEEFDGTTWESRGGRSVTLRPPAGALAPLPRRRLPKGESVEQRLRFLAGGSDALFCLGMPTAVGGDGARAGILLIPRGEVRTEEAYAEGAVFTIRSLAVPGEYAPVDGEDLSGSRRARLLAVPPDHERASALARGELGASAGLTGTALLSRMESFLARRCRYSLDIAPAGESTPVEAFLFDARRGHCELFASAAAVMLRSLGVPARVVVGFRGGLFERAAGRYTLRGADAHAWTEAWFEETGWVTFDPTPSSDPLRPDAPEAVDGEGAGGPPIAGLLDRVLRFDGAAGRRMIAGAGALVAAIWTNTIAGPDRGIGIPLLVAGLLLLGVGLLLRGRAPAAAAASPARSAPPPPPPPEAWALLLDRLSALGLRRGPAETGLEFAARARAAGVRPAESLDRLAAAYAEERFGGRPPTGAARGELRALAALVSVP